MNFPVWIIRLGLSAALLLLVSKIFAQQPVCKDAIDRVEQDSLVRFVKIISGREQAMINGELKTISSRYAYHPDNELAASYLKQTCMEYGLTIQDIPFSSTGKNIVAYKNGTESDKAAYVLCAHYDCVGSSSTAFQGADDNASGVAALLEAARVLQHTTFPYTIVLAFWDEEEIGLLGSQAFAPDGPIGYWDVKGVINLDMIAWDGDNDSLAMIHAMPVGSSVSLALKMTELNIKYGTQLQTVIQNPGETSTDQESFWLKGATAVGLTEDYKRDLNPNWHRLGDSIENFNLPYFTKVSKLAIAGICELVQTGKVTGVGTIAKEHFMIYPNPVGSLLTIQTNHVFSGGQIALYQVTGEKHMQMKYEGGEIQLRTESLPEGMYILEISTPEQSFQYPLVKVAE